MSGEHRHNLPVRLLPLIGREEELAVVRQRLLGAERGLLTLTGAGGCGKTRLALEVASELRDQFRDGTWLVELASLAEPALVPKTLASALGVREGQGRPILDALLAFLEPRALLLLLDNCEHLIDACADFAESLVSTCPELRILATSREPLRISGEATWRVPSLAAPDLDRLPANPDELARYPAVRLFVERARAVQPTFLLTSHNAVAVAQICSRLGGLPLALELAAARMSALSAEQIAGRLNDSFTLLTGGSRTAPSRQQTLEATLEWSFRLLLEPERALFRRLAAFAGGFDLGAAEAVSGSADVLDLLVRLVDKSLVLAEERGGAMRYRLLEPIRQYAQSRLTESEEREVVERAHAEHYLALAEEAEPLIRGPEQVAWLERLEREHDNLRAALAWSLEDPSDQGRTDLGLRLAAALGWFWWLHSHLREGRGWLDRALANGGTAAARARALAWGAVAARWSGDYERFAALCEQSFALSRQVGDLYNQGWAHITLGDAAGWLGDLDRSVEVEEAALASCREMGYPWLTAFSLEVLASSLRVLGDYTRAAACCEESLAMFRAIGDRRGIATALCDLGYVAVHRRDARRATPLLEESLRLSGEVREERRMVMCLEALAGVAVVTGRPGRAARLLGAARAWRDLVGAPMELADRAPNALTLEAARAALDPVTFQAVWEEGRRLSLDEAVALAFSGEEAGKLHGALKERPLGAVSTAPLTPRETEVAALVAEGLTNRQIAERLVISERTADNHVASILNKLALDNRSQVAVWASEHGLLPRRQGTTA